MRDTCGVKRQTPSSVISSKKGFGFAGGWTVNDQNGLIARLFRLQKVNKA